MNHLTKIFYTYVYKHALRIPWLFPDKELQKKQIGVNN